MDINKIREDFPILSRTMEGKPLAYLDNGATTLKPKPVIDAVMNYYTYLGANAHRGDYEMSAQVDEAYEGARKRACEFIHASVPEEIIFTSGSSEGLNQAALMIMDQILQPGDVVLTTESEHASSVLPWMHGAQTKGFTVEFIPLDEQGRITVENVKKVMSDKVKVVALAQVSNVLGFEAPVKEIAALAHANDALIVVDGAQSTPHLKIDVQDSDVDFFAFSAHKMCAPTGVGVLYGKKKWLDRLDPVYYGGESNARFHKTGEIILKESPFKFESGTQPIEGVLGLRAAMDYIEEIGQDNIHAHEVMLKKHFLKRIENNPNIKMYNAEAQSGICTFNVYDGGKLIPAQDVASYLNTLGIAIRSGTHCAKMLDQVLQVSGTCRASFYLYNTIEEVDCLVEGLNHATLENCINIFF